MNYPQTLDYLFTALPSFQHIGADAYKPGLERIAAFARHLGNPHRNFFSVHVAGTNGKGSVAHILAAVLQQAGYRTGLFTSPHLQDFRERIRVDGQMIPKQRVVNFVDKHREKMASLDLSFFEMTAAMAFDHFAQSEVEVAVIETGLGGRLDATNIVVPLLSVITNIGLEHTALLGSTREAIAREKAGIIKKSIPVVVGESSPETDGVFREVAEALRSEIRFADRDIALCHSALTPTGSRFEVERRRDGRIYTLELDMAGAYQRRNILTAFCALDTLHRDTPLSISTRALIEGCRDAAAITGLRGRWQVIGRDPLTVCDTGHNPDGLRWVMEQVEAQPCGRRFLVFGVAADKDLSRILPLLPGDAYCIFTQAASPRSLDARTLALQAAAAGLRGEAVPSVKGALERARALATGQDMIFVGGSTYVVAEAL